MPSPLLTTKLYLPTARPNLLPRPRLTARLAAGLQHPLTLISAPAGFGKTTILSDWRATPEGQTYPLAWLSLDSGDNDPGRFWAYVSAALRTLPDLAGLPAELDPGAAPDLLLAPLINGLAAASSPVMLVLDDYHTIEAPAIHTALNFLIEHMPAALRLVMLTRADPPWPLARLRANGRLAELRAADLRFTPQEAAAFFRHAGLSAAETAALAERTEGWAAALQMAALSLDGHPDPHGFVAAFSGENRFVTDYLTEEVLARQPEPLRQFLLQCSVLERLSAPLCSTVTGRPDSLALLEQTERSNLFLVPLDPVRQWFRFHHLFGSLLQTYLRQTEPELVPVLHRRAAAWHAENGLPLEAARHSLAAGDHDRTLQLIEEHAGGWWAMANPAFTALLAQIPPEVTRRSPQLCTYRAWMNCMFGQIESALDLIDTAERHPALPPDIRSFLALMRTYMADMSGQTYRLTEAVLQAPSYIPERGGADLRSAAELVLAYLLYSNGQLDRAAALWQQAADREAARGTTHAIPVAIPLLARIRLIEGQPADAATLCRRYIAIVRERGEAGFFVWGNLLAVLADALCLQGRLEEAEAAAREAIEVNQAFTIAHAAVLPLHALARVRLAQGAADEALKLLDQEEQVTRTGLQTPDTLADRTALRVQAWLAAGDLQAAARWARESRLTTHDPLSFRQELTHIAFAQVLLATGRATEAETLLARLERAAEAGGRWGHVAEIKRLRQQAQAPAGELLTEREREILQLIADGRSNQEIARSLVVAVGTVKTHVHNLLEKLGAQSRTEAVALGRERHLLK